jgi:hypothetical protein
VVGEMLDEEFGQHGGTVVLVRQVAALTVSVFLPGGEWVAARQHDGARSCLAGWIEGGTIEWAVSTPPPHSADLLISTKQLG